MKCRSMSKTGWLATATVADVQFVDAVLPTVVAGERTDITQLPAECLTLSRSEKRRREENQCSVFTTITILKSCVLTHRVSALWPPVAVYCALARRVNPRRRTLATFGLPREPWLPIDGRIRGLLVV